MKKGSEGMSLALNILPVLDAAKALTREVQPSR